MGELRRVKQLADGNRKRTQLVANLSLDKHILQDVLSKKNSAGWAAARDRRARPGVSRRQRAAQLPRARRRLLVVRYVSHKPDQAPLRLRIHDLAAARMRYGYFRIYILLRREGWLVNYEALLSLSKGVSTRSIGRMD